MASTVKLILLAFVTQCLADHGAWQYYMPRVRNYYIRRQNKGGSPTKAPTKTPATTPKKPILPNLENSYFQALQSYQVDAKPVTETTYPWIARVVHSRTEDYPYVCTAVCVEESIFITAARCIVNLKTILTTVIYQKFRFASKVFVLPSRPSRQMFDDIGIIVVEPGQYTVKWLTVQIFDTPRNDEHFQWFADLNLDKSAFKAIGYVAKKFFHKIRTPNLEFNLSELDVVVDIYMCSNILSKGRKELKNSFLVPCYHSCTENDFKKNKPACEKFLGTEGGAVLNVKTNRLLGVATWGVATHDRELPVGFAVPNSDTYFQDMACARKIKNDKTPQFYRGYYQNLCIM